MPYTLIAQTSSVDHGAISIIDALESPNERLSFVSDGRVEDGNGIFGWSAG
jgi:hypothetical protein